MPQVIIICESAFVNLSYASLVLSKYVLQSETCLFLLTDYYETPKYDSINMYILWKHYKSAVLFSSLLFLRSIPLNTAVK